jgi:hypothetical protein
VLTARQLLGLLLAGLSLLGFGTLLGNQRRAQEQGMLPIALALKIVGVALLTWTLWRHVKGNLG